MLPQLSLAENIVARRKLQLPQLQFLGRSHPCCGAEAGSHGLADHGISPVVRSSASLFLQVV